jgi:NAD(P)-dependent dehydrogenase (short-subunit alcohol dehydrogenase family)
MSSSTTIQREEPDASEVIQLIKAEGRKAIPIPSDLREESYCKDLVAKAFAELGGLDIVVSNAGRQQRCEVLQLTTEGFDATMKNQHLCPFWIIKAHAARFVHHCHNLRAGTKLERN